MSYTFRKVIDLFMKSIWRPNSAFIRILLIVALSDVCYHIVTNLVIIQFFQILLRARSGRRYCESIQKLLVADKYGKLRNLSTCEG